MASATWVATVIYPNVGRHTRRTRCRRLLWQDLLAPNPHDRAETLARKEHMIFLDEAGVDPIAEAFAAVIVAKSPWNHKHSQGAANIYVGIGQLLGL